MARITLDPIRLEQKTIVEYSYSLRPVVHGYANRTLKIDLGEYIFEVKLVTQEMKEIFFGGRGFCLWLLWNSTRPETKWNDGDNELVIAGAAGLIKASRRSILFSAMGLIFQKQSR